MSWGADYGRRPRRTGAASGSPASTFSTTMKEKIVVLEIHDTDECWHRSATLADICHVNGKISKEFKLVG